MQHLLPSFQALLTQPSTCHASCPPPPRRQTLLDVSGQVPPEIVDALVAACKGGSFGKLQALLTDIISDGYSAQQLLLQLSLQLLGDASVADDRKAKVWEVVGEADKCLVDGSDEFLQLLQVTAQAQKVFNG
jgi:replication factor C subunit 2/4